MTKAEFLATLRSKLMGEVSTLELENTIRYYEEYISDAVRGGKSEEAVLDELGNPLLIAKTIIDTAGRDVDGPDRVFHQGNTDQSREPEHGSGGAYHSFQLNSWRSKLAVVAVVVVVLILIFTILSLCLLSVFRNRSGRSAGTVRPPGRSPPASGCIPPRQNLSSVQTRPAPSH